MLVLSRKENETIIIDNQIRVTVVHCGRGKVKIGIKAPEEVAIRRAEIACRDERRQTLVFDSETRDWDVAPVV